MRRKVLVDRSQEPIDFALVAGHDPDVADLWREYYLTRSDYSLGKLMRAYQWFTRMMARRAMRMIFHQQGLGLERDDLVSIANLALLEALERYEPNAGASFLTFARRRVWGELVDEMRRLSFVKRGDYERLREKGELPRIKSFEDLAPGNAEHTPRRRYGDYEDWEDRFLARAQMDEIRDREYTEEILEAVERALRDARVSPRDRQIFELHYFAEVTQADIAERYHLHYSRVSQILSDIRDKIQQRVMAELPYLRPHADDGQ